MATLSSMTSVPSSGWMNAQSIYKIGLIWSSSILITWTHLCQITSTLSIFNAIFQPNFFSQSFFQSQRLFPDFQIVNFFLKQSIFIECLHYFSNPYFGGFLLSRWTKYFDCACLWIFIVPESYCCSSRDLYASYIFSFFADETSLLNGSK